MIADWEGLFNRVTSWHIEVASFHETRQLSDEILIADGWAVFEDPEWEGGIRWSRGTTVVYSTTEASRPHPILSAHDALGLVPMKSNFRLERVDGRHYAAIWNGSAEALGVGGRSSSEAAAICAAFVMMRWQISLGRWNV